MWLAACCRLRASEPPLLRRVRIRRRLDLPPLLAALARRRDGTSPCRPSTANALEIPDSPLGSASSGLGIDLVNALVDRVASDVILFASAHILEDFVNLLPQISPQGVGAIRLRTVALPIADGHCAPSPVARLHAVVEGEVRPIGTCRLSSRRRHVLQPAHQAWRARQSKQDFSSAVPSVFHSVISSCASRRNQRNTARFDLERGSPIKIGGCIHRVSGPCTSRCRLAHGPPGYRNDRRCSSRDYRSV